MIAFGLTLNRKDKMAETEFEELTAGFSHTQAKLIPLLA